MQDKSMRDRILDAAEARAGRSGYNAFSFRDLAEDVGVKSASIHYHFPTKPDLAEALTRRYTERIKMVLGDPAEAGAEGGLARIVAVFRDALTADDRMCLCGLFGAERDILPPAVDLAVTAFFRMMLDYLRTALGEAPGRPRPEAVLSVLEGALILARSLRDISLFDAAAGSIAGAIPAGSASA